MLNQFHSRCDGAAPAFDNVLARMRGRRCVISRTAPPFMTVRWPDLGALASEMRLPQLTPASLEDPAVRSRFLAVLAEGPPGYGDFRPGRIAFASGRAEIGRVGAYRSDHRRVLLLGVRSRGGLLAALTAAAARQRLGATIDIEFRGWDSPAASGADLEVLRDACGGFYEARGVLANVLLRSDLAQIDARPWEFVYDRPRVRVAWLALLLAGCQDVVAFEEIHAESAVLWNLGKVADGGLWPHIVLPATKINVALPPEMVPALLELTRGASIDIAPAPFLSPIAGAEAPAPCDYAQALLALYRNPAVPVRLVSPLSWAAARMNSQVTLVRSAASAGAEIAVTPNGDLYAGEFGVGIERWRIGNVLQASGSVLTFSAGGEGKMAEEGAGLTPTLHWERLDAVPETFSNAMQPERCQTCDWRYRCGGLDASVFQLEERRRLASQRGSPGTAAEALERIEAWPEGEMACDDGGWSDLAELYCAPRKALFEEMLWDCAEGAAQRQTAGPREGLELSDEGITYVPVTAGAEG